MEIYILNKTSSYTNNQIYELVSKIQSSFALKQFCQDWNIDIPKLYYIRIGWPFNPSNINISIFDHHLNKKSYHSLSIKNNIPFANIFCNPSKNNLSILFTHELFELLINPYMEETFTFQNEIYLKEVCDPVSDNYFQENNLKISDWILPNWFEKDFCGNTNHLNTLKKSFELSSEGYMQKPNFY